MRLNRLLAANRSAWQTSQPPESKDLPLEQQLDILDTCFARGNADGFKTHV